NPFLNADHLSVQGCSAIGGAGGTATGTGNGGAGGDAGGGAIDILVLFVADSGGSLQLPPCTLLDNKGPCGDGGGTLGSGLGGNGGNAEGGAVFLDPLASGVILDSAFVGDAALGGSGGGGAIPGTDGQGLGGAIFNGGSLVINRRTTFRHDLASTADNDVS